MNFFSPEAALHSISFEFRIQSLPSISPFNFVLNQVAASMKMDVNAQVPYYPNLPSKLLCILHNVTLHADPETDEVYAQMTLQPVSSFDKEALLRSDLTLKVHKPQTEFFCKTLTASDASTHGGFSVPRRAAEKICPPLLQNSDRK